MNIAPLAFFEHCPGLLFTIDKDGSFVHQSKALRERFAIDQSEGTSLADLAQAEDRAAIERFLRALAEAEDPASCSFRAADPGGGSTRLRCRAARSPDGQYHGVLEAIPEDDDERQVKEVMLRAIADTLEIVLWAVDRDGVFVFHDGKALPTAGLEPGQFLGQNIFDLYSPEQVESIHKVLAGEPMHGFSETHGVHWESWTIPLRGATGEVEYCVGVTLDIGERVKSEQELKRQLKTITRQQQAIHELAAPVLQVWDRVLAVPLIGMMDGERIAELGERLLAQVSRMDIRFAVLDMTGIDALDTAIASDIIRLLSSLQLLGVEGMVCGIGPQVAQTMVGLGIEFDTIRTYRSLREALRACLLAFRKS